MAKSSYVMRGLACSAGVAAGDALAGVEGLTAGAGSLPAPLEGEPGNSVISQSLSIKCQPRGSSPARSAEVRLAGSFFPDRALVLPERVGFASRRLRRRIHGGLAFARTVDSNPTRQCPNFFQQGHPFSQVALCLTERVGFEPTVPEGTLVFETSPFSRSGTSPRIAPVYSLAENPQGRCCSGREILRHCLAGFLLIQQNYVSAYVEPTGSTRRKAGGLFRQGPSCQGLPLCLLAGQCWPIKSGQQERFRGRNGRFIGLFPC